MIETYFLELIFPELGYDSYAETRQLIATSHSHSSCLPPIFSTSTSTSMLMLIFSRSSSTGNISFRWLRPRMLATILCVLNLVRPILLLTKPFGIFVPLSKICLQICSNSGINAQNAFWTLGTKVAQNDRYCKTHFQWNCCSRLPNILPVSIFLCTPTINPGGYHTIEGFYFFATKTQRHKGTKLSLLMDGTLCLRVFVAK